MKRPQGKLKLTGQERCDILSRIAGQLSLNVSDELRRSETPKAYAKYRAFIRSLDGAIRHAQRQRDSEERCPRCGHQMAHFAGPELGERGLICQTPGCDLAEVDE